MEISDKLNIPPLIVGLKFRVASTPSPAGRLLPDKENPRAIPVSVPKEIKSDNTPVK